MFLTPPRSRHRLWLTSWSLTPKFRPHATETRGQCRVAKEKESIELYLRHICKCSTPAPWTPEHRALLSEHPPCQTTATQPKPSVSCQEMEHIPPLSPSCSLCFLPTPLQATSGSALGNDSENETASMQSKRERKQKVKHVLMRTALLTSEVTPRQPSVPGYRRSTQPIDGPSSCNEPHVCVSKFFLFLNRNLPERPSGAFFVYLPIFQPSTTWQSHSCCITMPVSHDWKWLQITLQMLFYTDCPDYGLSIKSMCASPCIARAVLVISRSLKPVPLKETKQALDRVQSGAAVL